MRRCMEGKGGLNSPLLKVQRAVSIQLVRTGRLGTIRPGLRRPDIDVSDQSSAVVLAVATVAGKYHFRPRHFQPAATLTRDPPQAHSGLVPEAIQCGDGDRRRTLGS